MATTTTTVQTLQEVANQGNPTTIADVLRKFRIGDMFDVQEYDTGTITASATIDLPAPGALMVQSARVVTSGTAGAVGCYLVADSASTPVTPAAANTQPGVAKLSANGITLTFPSTVTRVVVRYIKNSFTDLDALFLTQPTT